MLKIVNLKKHFGGVKAVDNCSFEVKENTITALIGPNGSGKTTTLKSIFNLCNIISGKIMFKDKNITKLPTHELIYEGISYVPQGRQVFSDLTVRENLEMGAFVFNDKDVVEKNIQDIFNKFPFSL